MASTMLPALSNLDPAEAWRPWQPDSQNPWNLKWAAHLHRRAAFGAPAYQAGATAWEALQQSVTQGFEASLQRLFDGCAGQTEFDGMMDGIGPKIGRGPRFDFQPDVGLGEVQGWWVYRMAFSPHPLREKLTLFWHNHFATSVAKVKRSTLMLKQNQLLRRHALGKFRPFLLEMSKDPAMLIWLDGNANVKSHPNENYARELLELFSLGVGNYTEPDIREAARAFTGWHIAGTEYLFNPAQHDDGDKTILGQKGKWNGEDVIRIALEQPAAARFLVRKLYRYFISENESPPDALVEPLAEQLRKSDYDMGPLVRTMLRSRLFFSQHAYRQRIKSPAEYVLGLVRLLDVRIGPGNLAKSMSDLGQKLFAPPNVKGWDGGKAWLNSGTMLARHNLAWDLVSGGGALLTRYYQPAPGVVLEQPADPHAPPKPVGFFDELAGKDAAVQLDTLLDFTLQGDVQATAREKLVAFLRDKTPEKPAEQAPTKEGQVRPDQRLREVLHTILLLPEFQLA
jgi:hypothetical protein